MDGDFHFRTEYLAYVLRLRRVVVDVGERSAVVEGEHSYLMHFCRQGDALQRATFPEDATFYGTQRLGQSHCLKMLVASKGVAPYRRHSFRHYHFLHLCKTECPLRYLLDAGWQTQARQLLAMPECLRTNSLHTVGDIYKLQLMTSDKGVLAYQLKTLRQTQRFEFVVLKSAVGNGHHGICLVVVEHV